MTIVAFAPDGRKLASLGCQSPFVFAGDNTITGLKWTRGFARAARPAATLCGGVQPDGRWLASGSWDGTARLWDAATGELWATLPHPSAFVWNLAFGPDGTWLVTACPQDNLLRIWDTATGRVLRKIPLPHRNIHSLTLSPDGTRMAAMTPDSNNRKCLTVCEVPSGKSLYSTEGRPMAYSPDGRWLRPGTG